MKWIDYREQLNIGFGDSEKHERLRNILKNYIRYDLEDLYSFDSAYAFCNMIGELYNDTYYGPAWKIITDNLSNSTNTYDLISRYIAFCNTFQPFLKKDKSSFAEVGYGTSLYQKIRRSNDYLTFAVKATSNFMLIFSNAIPYSPEIWK